MTRFIPGVYGLTIKTKARRLASNLERHFATGYQSIGSFHSEDLSDILSIPEEIYEPPELPFESGHHDSDDFMLDRNWTFLNHGAFGAALSVGFHRSEQWRRYLEKQPLRYFDRSLLPYLAYCGRMLANFVSAPRQQVALMNNATSGLNSVLSGFARLHGPAAHIVIWDTTYGSVKKMAKHYFGGNVAEIPLQASYLDKLSGSTDPEQMLESVMVEFLSQLDWKDKNVLLVLDHTTSNTALTFPVQRLARAAKNLGVEMDVLVDGAHGLLAQDVRISDMPHVDCYITNGHKWFAAPRGVALMYAKPEWHDTVLRRPIVVTHGVDAPDLFSRFVWDGTRDYSSALSIPVVLDYWVRHGPATVRVDMKRMLEEGITVLAENWHDSRLCPSSWAGEVTLVDYRSSMLSPMALVRLPDLVGMDNTSTDAKRVQDHLFNNLVEAPIKCINGRLYVRVSCHVYNGVRDFEHLAREVRLFAR